MYFKSTNTKVSMPFETDIDLYKEKIKLLFSSVFDYPSWTMEVQLASKCIHFTNCSTISSALATDSLAVCNNDSFR